MVLGFLSFMVISAVAFAIYMRTERVPSSALRRNTATRHLVKAAMAHAMSRVDDAIRNDPFPGLANTNGNNFANFYHDKDNNSIDLWLGRVFMPPDPAGLLDDNGSPVAGANEPGDANKFPWRFAPVTETVSVLNLEALGYLPPPLVNDVRFLSRSSWAAKWQNFPFDAGRFAFCAVNVSDYLDINRTKVGVRSSPLDSCVSLRGTLAYRSDGNEENVSESTFTSLAKMLGPEAVRQNYTNPDNDAGQAAGADTEYVSLLDYNLAFGANPGGISILGPLFYDWIYNNRGSRKYFYGGTIKTATGAMQARRQPFVTDSFVAQMSGGGVTNGTYGEGIDLASWQGQPFYGLKMSRKDAAEQDVAKATSSKCIKRMYDRGLIGEADVFTLYDYLDHDDVPLSLAMPDVECVPMVTAVELEGKNLAWLKVNPPATPNVETPKAPGPGTRITTTEFTLDPSSFLSSVAGVRILLTYPFRHFNGRNLDFKVQVAMKVFVAAGDVSVRPNNGLSSLHPNPQSNGAEWNQPSKAFTIDGKAPGDALAWTLYSDKIKIPIRDENKTQDDALIQVDVTRWNGSADVPANQKFFTSILEEPGTVSPTGGFTPTPGASIQKYQFNLRPYKDGEMLTAEAITVKAGSTLPYSTDPFRTYAMLWVRIVDKDDNTVDLAPAIMADDMLNNKQNNFGVLGSYGGNAPGCLLFSTDPAKAYTYENILKGTFTGLDGSDPKWRAGTGSDAKWKSLAVVDPRYNYAPEDWFTWDKGVADNQGKAWLDEICETDYLKVDMQDGGTRDIFMFTSNQGYLQSPGEFAFLPRLSQWNNEPNGRISSILKNAPGASASAEHADSPQKILNGACAWRTYPVDRTLYEDFVKVGIGRGTDGIQKVNPYSDDEAVLQAVFAYTPCDYWTAGRIVADMKFDELAAGGFPEIVKELGDNSKISGDPITANEYVKFVFCDKNDDESSRMESKDVRAIMQSFAQAFFAGGGRPWEEIYDAMPWFEGLNPEDDDSFKNFMGVKLDNCPLYSIDRKFLYSYWRDCFANKQQLFLIFVRAESTALGGPGEGTPSQQGGRAVALVWREPAACDVDNHSDTRSDNQLDPNWMQEESVRRRRPHRMRVLFYHQFD